MPRRPADLQLRSQLVGPFLAYVRAQGGDADGLIRRLDLPATAERDPEVVLSLSVLRDFFEAVEEAVGEPFVGVRVAQRFPRGTWGLLEFTTRLAPTLREALQRMARYMPLANEVVSLAFEERPGEGSLEHRIAGAPLCLGRHGNEFWMTALLAEARKMTGRAVVPKRVWLAHPAPRDTRELQVVFGTSQVDFGAGANGFTLSAEDLAAPNTSSDPALLSLLEHHANQAISQLQPLQGLPGLVRQRLRESLGQRLPSIQEMARRLRLSPRTLQRRLSDEGTSFQQQLDAVREELARVYVRESKLPLGEVAYLLGYSELSTFLRAFRRWTGKTPSQFRES
ncbi:MAG TPA: AraC family transcriptional regulator [Hyalangium sp.]|nr:AraC family transcriptional regulator [Hyalangium sp.]